MIIQLSEQLITSVHWAATIQALCWVLGRVLLVKSDRDPLWSNWFEKMGRWNRKGRSASGPPEFLGCEPFPLSLSLISLSLSSHPSLSQIYSLWQRGSLRSLISICQKTWFLQLLPVILSCSRERLRLTLSGFKLNSLVKMPQLT